MKKIYGVLEPAILILMGIWGIWFSLSDNYTWLMNEKFRVLTLLGFIMLFIIGVVAIVNPHKRTAGNSIVFLLSIILMFIGKPLSKERTMNKIKYKRQ